MVSEVRSSISVAVFLLLTSSLFLAFTSHDDYRLYCSTIATHSPMLTGSSLRTRSLSGYSPISLTTIQISFQNLHTGLDSDAESFDCPMLHHRRRDKYQVVKDLKVTLSLQLLVVSQYDRHSFAGSVQSIALTLHNDGDSSIQGVDAALMDSSCSLPSDLILHHYFSKFWFSKLQNLLCLQYISGRNCMIHTIVLLENEDEDRRPVISSILSSFFLLLYDQHHRSVSKDKNDKNGKCSVIPSFNYSSSSDFASMEANYIRRVDAKVAVNKFRKFILLTGQSETHSIEKFMICLFEKEERFAVYGLENVSSVLVRGVPENLFYYAIISDKVMFNMRKYNEAHTEAFYLAHSPFDKMLQRISTPRIVRHIVLGDDFQLQSIISYGAFPCLLVMSDDVFDWLLNASRNGKVEDACIVFDKLTQRASKDILYGDICGYLTRLGLYNFKEHDVSALNCELSYVVNGKVEFKEDDDTTMIKEGLLTNSHKRSIKEEDCWADLDPNVSFVTGCNVIPFAAGYGDFTMVVLDLRLANLYCLSLHRLYLQNSPKCSRSIRISSLSIVSVYKYIKNVRDLVESRLSLSSLSTNFSKKCSRTILEPRLSEFLPQKFGFSLTKVSSSLPQKFGFSLTKVSSSLHISQIEQTMSSSSHLQLLFLQFEQSSLFDVSSFSFQLFNLSYGYPS